MRKQYDTKVPQRNCCEKPKVGRGGSTQTLRQWKIICNFRFADRRKFLIIGFCFFNCHEDQRFKDVLQPSQDPDLLKS